MSCGVLVNRLGVGRWLGLFSGVDGWVLGKVSSGGSWVRLVLLLVVVWLVCIVMKKFVLVLFFVVRWMVLFCSVISVCFCCSCCFCSLVIRVGGLVFL